MSDVTWGGAAIACRRLVDGLVAAGLQVERAAAVGDVTTGWRLASDWPHLGWLIRKRMLAVLRASPVRCRRASHALNEAGLLRLLAVVQPSLLHLHNLHAAVSFRFLEALPSGLPIVWTMHDMWPFTGYCSYSYDCGRYRTGCPEPCPQNGLQGQMLERQDRVWQRQRRFFSRRGKLVLVSPSRWLAEAARSRLGDGVRVERIANPLDLSVFCPLPDRAAVRRSLNLPGNRFLILTGAHCLTDSRKGADLLREAWERLPADTRARCVIVALGDVLGGAQFPAEWLTTGLVRDEAMLNLYYNAADLYVLPTLADNLPNTLVESVSAGTPCVACDRGGCGDVVVDGQSGFLVPCEADALAEGILRVLALLPEERAVFQQRCRALAEQEFGMSDPVSRYKDVYASLLGTATNKLDS